MRYILKYILVAYHANDAIKTRVIIKAEKWAYIKLNSEYTYTWCSRCIKIEFRYHKEYLDPPKLPPPLLYHQDHHNDQHFLNWV